MNYETRNYINRLAEVVIDAYHITIPVQNIDEVVATLGGRIEVSSSFDAFDGTIRKDGESGFCIKLSQYQADNRRTFTIAHELGHLFLHMGFKITPDVWKNQDQTTYARFGRTEQEYQANEFAAALLMPQQEYKKVLDMNTVGNQVDISKVAQYFNVSSAAANNRGRFLGYLV